MRPEDYRLSYDDLLAVYNLWGDTLTACGLTPSIKQVKAAPPTKALDLLGVHVDVIAGFVSLPEAKRAYYFPLIDSWLAVTITRKVMQSLVGKLGWCCPIQPLCRGWCCRGWCW
mmetsp:Transcript_36258/g.85140  ORF Transcript_36258/g.85140 Transcript_36258/m.85140 type:complete len:114 (+) Transcript_36258:528-869(+)